MRNSFLSFRSARRRHACRGFIGLAALLIVAHVDADERAWTARELHADGLGRQVRLAEDGSTLQLDAGVLVEDDGPAAGFSYRPNEEQLGRDVRVRKELRVNDPRARAATLLVGGVGEFSVAVNGAPQTLAAPEKAGNYWFAYSLPVGSLRAGLNEITLAGSGKSRIWIARDDEFAGGSTERPRHPDRSEKSRDGGATWSRDKLGTQDDVDGEYYVRLFLDQHFVTGTYVSPVIDLGNLTQRAVGPPVTAIDSAEIRLAGARTGQGTIRLRTRAGTTPTIGAETWSEWSAWSPPNETGVKLAASRGRYLQYEVELTTRDPRESPRWAGVTIRSDPRRVDDWAARLRATKFQHDPLVRSSIPFAYEPFDHLALAELRRVRKLDEVTAGAKSEFELITRLAAWASQQWKKGHLAEIYPRWNALDILRPYGDGSPLGGFCQQYNLLLLQACESYGLCGRPVSLGAGDHGLKIRSGHEAVEIWSNEYRQWVYVDGDTAWYFADASTNRPLSLRELRERQLRAWRRVRDGGLWSAEETRVVQLGEPRREWRHFGDWPPLAELRMIPRSDFLRAPTPVPLNQGMRGWFWTGHYAWTDAQYPASRLYGHRVSREADWNWTLNGVRVTLESRATPGELLVHLETNTPGFGAYEASIDGGPTIQVHSGFVWRLHGGTNRLQVRTRNQADRLGPPSDVTLEYESL